GASLPGTAPAGWLELEQKGGLLRFIATNYESEATERACRENFPGGSVTAHPLTLREIFVTLARETRHQPQGAAV
ncbi:MAG: hypothetical protein ABUL68_05080, partial [Pseudomonadota bacterium]